MMFNDNIIKIIILSFVLSVCTSFVYIQWFDRQEISTDEKQNHAMIKSDPAKYWRAANEITKEMRNSAYKSDGKHKDVVPSLYPRLIALYAYITGLKYYENENDFSTVVIGGKLGFFIFQALLYYLIVGLFYFTLSSIVSKRIAFIATTFLAFEPTLNQFHSSFWSESIFISLLLLIFTLTLKQSGKYHINLIIGILVALLLMQRPVAIFYILLPIIFIVLDNKKKSIVPVIIIVLGYYGSLFIEQSKNEPDQYGFGTLIEFLGSQVIADAENTDRNIARIRIVKEFKDRVKESIDPNDTHQVDVLELQNDIYKDLAVEIFINKYPFLTIKHLTRNMIVSIFFDPLRLYYFYSGEYKPMIIKKLPSYYKLRYLYTVAILGISFIGFVLSWKRLNQNVNLFILLSILYIWGFGGWVGNSRYFIPAIVYLSIYFGIAIDFILESINLNKRLFYRELLYGDTT